MTNGRWITDSACKSAAPPCASPTNTITRHVAMIAYLTDGRSTSMSPVHSSGSLTHLALELSVSRLPPLVATTSPAVTWGGFGSNGARMLRHELSCQKGRLLLSVLYARRR